MLIFSGSSGADDRRGNENVIINSKGKEMIEKMAGESTNAMEDFRRAVDVEALCPTKKKDSSSQSGDMLFSVVMRRARLLLGRLKSVETGYHQDLRCMKALANFSLNKLYIR